VFVDAVTGGAIAAGVKEARAMRNALPPFSKTLEAASAGGSVSTSIATKQ
jgi:hypothetical protein